MYLAIVNTMDLEALPLYQNLNTVWSLFVKDLKKIQKYKTIMTSFITPYCISAYVICKTAEGPLYLLIRRCGKYLPGTWQMISGGIENSETAPQAAMREIKEETGLIPYALYSADAVETFYMQSNDKITFVPVFVAFVEDKKITLSATEHDAYEWLPFEEAKNKLVWSEQRRVINQIHESCVLKDPSELLRVMIKE